MYTIPTSETSCDCWIAEAFFVYEVCPQKAVHPLDPWDKFDLLHKSSRCFSTDLRALLSVEQLDMSMCAGIYYPSVQYVVELFADVLVCHTVVCGILHNAHRCIRCQRTYVYIVFHLRLPAHNSRWLMSLCSTSRGLSLVTPLTEHEKPVVVVQYSWISVGTEMFMRDYHRRLGCCW